MVVLRFGCRCRLSVSIKCGRIMVGLSLLSSISKHNMWYLGWVVVVSVNTIYGRIMVGLSLVSKHNIWSYYGWSVSIIYGRIMVGFVVVFQ